MQITKPDQITGPVVRELRESTGMTQPLFWGAVNISKQRGSNYEKGIRRVDPAVQLLLYLRFVCGLPMNLPHETMKAACAIVTHAGTGIAAIQQAATSIESAVGKIHQAKQELESI